MRSALAQKNCNACKPLTKVQADHEKPSQKSENQACIDESDESEKSEESDIEDEADTENSPILQSFKEKMALQESIIKRQIEILPLKTRRLPHCKKKSMN